MICLGVICTDWLAILGVICTDWLAISVIEIFAKFSASSSLWKVNLVMMMMMIIMVIIVVMMIMMLS